MEKFLVDIMLGKLARWLRILGYNAIYANIKEIHILFYYLENGYIFLTRRGQWKNCRHLKGKAVYFVQSDKWPEQLKEIVNKYNLKPYYLFSRCIVCNTPLVKKEKNELLLTIPEYVAHSFSQFKFCPKCKRIYWPGTHQKRMREKLKEIFGENWILL